MLISEHDLSMGKCLLGIALWVGGFAWAEAASPNDEFAKRVGLGEETPATLVGDFTGASVEDQELHARQGSTVPSLWWEWQATTGGLAVIATDRDDVSVDMFQGETFSSMERVHKHYSDGNSRFRIEANRIYQVMLASSAGGLLSGSLKVENPNVVGYQNTPILLGSPTSFTMEGSFHGTTIEDTPVPETGGLGNLYWEWKAPGDGHLQFSNIDDRFPSGFDFFGVDAVHGWVWLGGRFVRRSGQNQILVVSKGNDYQFRLGGSRALQADFMQRGVFVPVAEDNKQLANATEIRPGSIEPTWLLMSHPGIRDNRESTATRWWKWQATGNGVLIIDRIDYRTVLDVDVFGIDDEGGLTELAVPNSFPGRARIRSFLRVEAGAEYRIRMIHDRSRLDPTIHEPADLTVFDVKLNFFEDQHGANSWLAREDLGAVETTRFGVLMGERLQIEPTPGTTSPAHPHSAWWTWTAPVDGKVTIGVYENSHVKLDVFEEPLGLESEPLVSGFSGGVSFGTRAGKNYALRMAGSDEALKAAIVLELETHAVPDNDDFVNRHDLGTTTEATWPMDFRAATLEENEPTDDRFGVGSLWWSWTAPQDGRVRLVSVEDLWTFTDFAVYIGDRLEALEKVSMIASEFFAKRGQTYQIAMVSIDSVGMLSLALNPHPANLTKSQAHDLGDATSISVPGSTVNAWYDESDQWFSDTEPTASVWYRWKAPETPTWVSLSLDPSFDGDRRTASVNVVNEQTGEQLGHHFFTEADASYGIRVSSLTVKWDRFWRGDFVLSLRAYAPPENDDFWDAEEVPSIPLWEVQGNNLGATLRIDEPSHGDLLSPQQSVWYTWRAPSDGVVSLKLESTRSQAIAVYSGDSIDQLDDLGVELDHVRFAATAQSLYRIAVISPDFGSSGAFVLSGSLAPRLPNDDLAEAVTIEPDTTAPWTTALNFEGTSPSKGDRGSDSVTQAWFAWKPESRYAARLFSKGVMTGLGVAVRVRVPQGEIRTSLIRDLPYTFDARPGWEYHIGFSAEFGIYGQQMLGLEIKEAISNDDFDSRTVLRGGDNLTVPFTLVGARIDSEEWFLPGWLTSSVHLTGMAWWDWQAPKSGRYVITLSNPLLETGVVAFTGTELSTLEKIQMEDGEIMVKAGDRVQLAVYGSDELWDNTLEIMRVLENRELAWGLQLTMVGEQRSLTYQRPAIEARERTYVYEVSQDLLEWERLVSGTNYTETIITTIDQEQVQVGLLDLGSAHYVRIGVEDVRLE